MLRVLPAPLCGIGRSQRLGLVVLLLLGVLSGCVSGGPQVAPPEPPHAAQAAPRNRVAWGDLPLHFEENRGQFDSQVAYAAGGGALKTYFTPGGVTLAMVGGDGVTLAAAQPAGRGDPHAAAADVASPRRWAVKMDFAGADPAAQPRPLERTEAVVSYFKGPEAEWMVGIPTYAGVAYADLWPGIDLTYRGDAGRLKYELLVQPGADPRQIRFEYRGASEVRVNEAGQLEIATPVGRLVDDVPTAFQELDGQRVEVAAEYELQLLEELDSTLVGFSVGAYDPAQPLVIDPTVFVYSGLIGGEGVDTGVGGVAVDGNGFAYVGGLTDSSETSFPTREGPDLSYNGGTFDAVVAKVKADGTGLVYLGYIGGDGSDSVAHIAVDARGNAYVVGDTGSSEATFPVVRGPDLTYNGGSADGFVAKLRADGTGLIFCGYVGGSGNEIGGGIALDDAGNAYIAGSTSSNQATFPVKNGPDLTSGGVYDAFVAKILSDGSALAYAGFIGGDDFDFGNAIAVDRQRNAYVTGDTPSTQATFPTLGGPDLSHNGDDDAFVVKVKANGSGFAYAGFIGGSATDIGRGIAVDRDGNAYISGTTSSTEASFPVQVGPDLTFNGDRDAFAVKVRANGSGLVYAGYVGGDGSDAASKNAVDGAGNQYLTGGTDSSEATFPLRGGPDLTFGGGDDAFITKVRANGSTLDYSGYIGGEGEEEAGRGVAIDSSGNVYVAGFAGCCEDSFPIVLGPGSTYGGGVGDFFVVKLATGELVVTRSHRLETTALQKGRARATSWVEASTPSGAPLKGARVTVELRQPNGTLQTRSAKTDRAGLAEVRFDVRQLGSYAARVIGIELKGRVFLPGPNDESGPRTADQEQPAAP